MCDFQRYKIIQKTRVLPGQRCVCVLYKCVCAFTQGRRCVSAMCVSLLQCCEGGLDGVTLLRGWGGCGTRNCGGNNKDTQRFKWTQRPGKGQRSNEKVTKGSKDKARGRERERLYTSIHTDSLPHTGQNVILSLWWGNIAFTFKPTNSYNWTELTERKREIKWVRQLFRERKR